MTNGAFDVTVQPLWNIYNKSFTDLGKPPSNTQISNALKLVDWKSIKVEKTKEDINKRIQESLDNPLAN